MKVNKEELLKSLGIIKPATASNDIITQSDCFAFLGDRIATYNDDIAISVPTSIPIKGAVASKEFYASLGKLKGTEIEMGIHNNELQMQARRTKIGIKFDTDVVLPLSELGKMNKWEKIPKGMLDALEFCMFSASTDMSSPKFTCLYLHDSVVEATDRHRVTQYTFKGKFKEKILIPAANVVALIKHPVRFYCATNGWIHFQAKDKLVFSSRIYNESFPDCTKLLIIKNGNTVIFPSTLVSALDRVEVFGKAMKDVESTIQIQLEKKQMILRGESDIGWAEEVLKSKYKGKSLKFNIHPKFLRDIVETMNQCQTDGNRLVFEGDNFKHAISLMEE